MQLKSYDEMNPEQRAAYKIGLKDGLDAAIDDAVWILGYRPGDDAPWELSGCFITKAHALEEAREGEFIARVPIGRAPDETTVFPDAEWVTA